MIRPIDFPNARISQLWGANPTYYQSTFAIPYHNGTDYAAFNGTPICCIADGFVAYTGTDPPGYGTYVRIYHPHLHLFSFYAHLNHHTVTRNDQIKQGDIFATVGNSGNSTGPHLHFEIRLGINERQYAASPYTGITRGRVNPETIFRYEENAQRPVG